ncbi:unnamed protein product, partial [Nesidiocoris tenuis]
MSASVEPESHHSSGSRYHSTNQTNVEEVMEMGRKTASTVSFTLSSPRTASLLHAGMSICQPSLAKVVPFYIGSE